MPSTVRAKFHCASVAKLSDGGTHVQMHPVYSGCAENKAFNDATPGGDLRLHIAKDKPAAELFEAGKDYFIDITQA